MLHYRDKPICVSPLALWSEADLRGFDESTAAVCKARGSLLIRGKLCLRRLLLSWWGG
jgi:hypothetical protein